MWKGTSQSDGFPTLTIPYFETRNQKKLKSSKFVQRNQSPPSLFKCTTIPLKFWVATQCSIPVGPSTHKGHTQMEYPFLYAPGLCSTSCSMCSAKWRHTGMVANVYICSCGLVEDCTSQNTTRVWWWYGNIFPCCTFPFNANGLSNESVKWKRGICS